MRKLFTLFVLAFVLAFSATAQVTYNWATGFGGSSGYDPYTRMARDNSGNVYVIGTFQGTKYFGAYTLVGGGFYDSYIAKFDASGVCQWATACTGANFSSVYGCAITVDNNFNVYVAGVFTNTATISPYTVNSSQIGLNDIFIARLDYAGNCVWLSKAGGASIDEATSVCLKPTGELLVTGSFIGTANFDTQSLSSGSTTTSNIFLAQYDIVSGLCSWAVNAGGTSDDKGLCVTTDNAGSILLSGYYFGSATFGSQTVSSTANSRDAFVAKYNSTGVITWVAHGGGQASANANSVAVDASNNVYVAGDFADTITIGTTQLTDNGYGNIWLAKVNGSNGSWMWAKKAGGISYDGANAIGVNAGGASFITGLFNGTANFSGQNITSAGSSDVFIAKYDVNGNKAWVTKLGGSNSDIGKAIVATGNNQCVLAGTYYGPVTVGSTTLTSAPGDFNDFITTLNAGTLGIFDMGSPESFSVSPNPSNGVFKIIVPHNFSGKPKVEIMDALGKVVYTQYPDNTFADNEISVDAAGFAKGIYSVMLTSETNVLCAKILIQKQSVF